MRDPKHKSQRGGSGFWKPKPDTTSIIRILPETGNMDVFWQEVGYHYPPGEGASSIMCPAFTTDEAEECAICEHREASWQTDKEEARKWYTRRTYRVNILVRRKEADDDGKKYDGPFVFTPGVTVFEQLEAIIGDDDYGDITSMQEGLDLKLTRAGSTREDTKYSVLPAVKKTPLVGKAGKPDEERIAEVMAAARDLSEVVETLPSSDELLAAAGLVSEDHDEGFEDEFEDYEEAFEE
jgi:hypothetical protein